MIPNNQFYFNNKQLTPFLFGDVVQYIDGTISGNEFIDKSGNGYNLDIINNDITISGFPYKSVALIAQKVANFGLIPDPTNFWFTAGVPNQIPVVSLFQNIDYVNQIFCRHVSQSLDSSGVEITEPFVYEIVTYTSALTGVNLTNASNYFVVPTKDATAVWVDLTNGSDVNLGTEVSPWLTLEKANATAASGLTVYIKTGASTSFMNPGATYYYVQTAHTWQSLGFVTLKNVSGTRVALLVGALLKNFKGIIFDGANSSSANIEVFSASTNNNFDRCKFINTTAYHYIQPTGSINFTNCVFDVGTKASVFRLNANISLVGCYFSGTLSFGIDDTLSTNYSNYTYCKFIVSLTSTALFKPSIASAAYIWNYNTFIISGTNPIICQSTTSLYTSINFNYNKIMSSSFVSSIMWRSSGSGAVVVIRNNAVALTNLTLNNSVFDVRESTSIDFSYNYINTLSTNDIPHIQITNGAGGTTNSAAINYNTLISMSGSGHVIIVGAESTAAGDNKINGGQCIGNKIYGPRYFNTSSSTSLHGLFIGFQKDWIVKYNYVNGTGINIIVKGTSTNSWTTGYISYNISVNGKLNNFYSKGISGVLFYNNTSYNDLNTGVSVYHFELSINTGGDGASNCVIKNNIIIEKSLNTLSKLISADDALSTVGLVSDYNVLYSLSGFYGYTFASTNNNFPQWQALGYDLNSINQDIVFNSILNEEFWPVAPIVNAEDLGVNFDDGLDVTTKWPVIVLKQQSSAWQCGAYIK